MTTCYIDGCEAQTRTNGLCNRHAVRARQKGTTDDGPKAKGTLEHRFWRKVDKRGDDECWPWTGSKSTNGYGNIGIGTKREGAVTAHRLSYTIHHGAVPEGLVVMHSCDNKGCVNPSHLSAGTIAENARQAVERGLHPRIAPKGTANGKAKLTPDMVRYIRANPDKRHLDIAREFGLSANTIRGVRTGRTWSHVN